MTTTNAEVFPLDAEGATLLTRTEHPCDVDLDDAEKIELGRVMALALKDAADEAEARKAHDKASRGREAEILEAAHDAARTLRRGTKLDIVECEWWADWKNERRVLVRDDTREVVLVEPMTDGDRQHPMFPGGREGEGTPEEN